MSAKLRDAHPAPEHLLRRPEVEARTGRSKAGIYCLIREGKFPAPLRIGKKAVAWRASEVDAWVAARATCEYAPLPSREKIEPSREVTA